MRPSTAAPALALLAALLLAQQAAAQVALQPASVDTNFHPPNLQAVSDNNPQTMMVSQRSIGKGEWIRVTVGSPGRPVTADGVRVLQHDQRHCDSCRIDYTAQEEPSADGDWTALQVAVSGPTLFLSLQQRPVRHVRLVATAESPNRRWHIKDIVVYGAAQGTGGAKMMRSTHSTFEQRQQKMVALGA